MQAITIEEVSQSPENEAILQAQLRISGLVDFKQQLGSLKNSGANDVLDEFGADNSYIERPIWLDKLFLLRLTDAGGDENAKRITLHLQAADDAEAAPTDADLAAALEHVRRRFWWELDVEAVRQKLLVNEYGTELVGRYWPSIPPNLPGAWEGLLKTVISNQVYPGLAVRLLKGLLEFYSDRKATFNGKLYRYYPTVEYLAEVSPDDLLGMKFSRQKAGYLPGIAKMVLAKPERFNWETLRQLPGEEAVAILDELPGVGPWTAHYVAMRGLPHLDVFIDEAGLRKTLAAAFDRRAELSSEEAAKLMAVFAPYRSMACYYSYMKMYNV